MQLPDLSRLTQDEKNALILALWGQVQALTAQVQTLVARVAELEAKLGEPPKTPDNSSLPPSKGKKPNRWNWVFQNDEVVIHVIRSSRGAGVVAEVLDGHRPALWVSDLYGAQQGHAEDWQICLAHQLRDCAYAIEAGDAVFAPRMKALLLRAVVLARRSRNLAPSTRREYRRRLECALDAVMALAPTHRDGLRLRRRYGKLRSHLFTFLDHPELPADNNGSERELRPTATYRKVTGGFRSDWGADLFAGVRSVIGTAARRDVGAYQAIQQTLRGPASSYPG